VRRRSNSTRTLAPCLPKSRCSASFTVRRPPRNWPPSWARSSFDPGHRRRLPRTRFPPGLAAPAPPDAATPPVPAPGVPPPCPVDHPPRRHRDLRAPAHCADSEHDVNVNGRIRSTRADWFATRLSDPIFRPKCTKLGLQPTHRTRYPHSWKRCGNG